jgi:hypothetical protein
LVIKSFKTLDPDPDSLEMHEIIFKEEAFFTTLFVLVVRNVPGSHPNTLTANLDVLYLDMAGEVESLQDGA